MKYASNCIVTAIVIIADGCQRYLLALKSQVKSFSLLEALANSCCWTASLFYTNKAHQNLCLIEGAALAAAWQCILVFLAPDLGVVVLFPQC